MAHPNNLAVQPELEPILYTHFDMWDCEHDSMKAISIARDLIQEWTDTTKIDFSSIAGRYLELGQTKFFWEAAEIFARNGYLVYDGDAFFEVYEMITLQTMLEKLTKFKQLTTNDGTLFFEDEAWLAVFTQLPKLLNAAVELNALTSLVNEAMQTGDLTDPSLFTSLKNSSDLLSSLNLDEDTKLKISEVISQ